MNGTQRPMNVASLGVETILSLESLPKRSIIDHSTGSINEYLLTIRVQRSKYIVKEFMT